MAARPKIVVQPNPAEAGRPVCVSSSGSKPIKGSVNLDDWERVLSGGKFPVPPGARVLVFTDGDSEIVVPVVSSS